MSSATAQSAIPLRPVGVAPSGPAARSVPPPLAQHPRRSRRRLAASFALMVLLPVALAGWYLWTRAADQYESRVSFAVRKEEVQGGLDLLRGLRALSGASSSDTDILYEFLTSQALVERLSARLDLAAIWGGRPEDPVFAYHGHTIEDLTSYAQRMLNVRFDTHSGLLSLNVRAFSAEAAQAIAAASLDEASDMINRLSNEARTDIVASSGTDLDTAMERLRNARLAMAEFRIRNNVVDPVADLQADLSVIASLQQELAQHQIALDILRSDAQPARRGDEQRLAEAETGIAAIKARIADERAKFGGGQERDYVALLSEFEDLTLNTEFAQQAYLGALAAHEAARADAQRQTRYLSAHIAPTWAESAVHPRRWLLLGMVAGFGFLLWATVSLGAAGLADRR